MGGQAQPRSVLLLGSVPLGSAAEVFETVGGTLGSLAPRIPDGETGDRLGWIAWTRDHFKTTTGARADRPARRAGTALPAEGAGTPTSISGPCNTRRRRPNPMRSSGASKVRARYRRRRGSRSRCRRPSASSTAFSPSATSERSGGSMKHGCWPRSARSRKWFRRGSSRSNGTSRSRPSAFSKRPTIRGSSPPMTSPARSHG